MRYLDHAFVLFQLLDFKGGLWLPNDSQSPKIGIQVLLNDHRGLLNDETTWELNIELKGDDLNDSQKDSDFDDHYNDDFL